MKIYEYVLIKAWEEAQAALIEREMNELEKQKQETWWHQQDQDQDWQEEHNAR